LGLGVGSSLWNISFRLTAAVGNRWGADTETRDIERLWEKTQSRRSQVSGSHEPI
jgi:hypothetical protein